MVKKLGFIMSFALIFSVMPMNVFAKEEYQCTITIDANKHTSTNRAFPTPGCEESVVTGWYDHDNGRFQLMGDGDRNGVANGEVVYLSMGNSVKVYTISLKPKPQPKPAPKPAESKPKQESKPAPKPQVKQDSKPKQQKTFTQKQQLQDKREVKQEAKKENKDVPKHDKEDEKTKVVEDKQLQLKNEETKVTDNEKVENKKDGKKENKENNFKKAIIPFGVGTALTIGLAVYLMRRS